MEAVASSWGYIRLDGVAKGTGEAGVAHAHVYRRVQDHLQGR